MCNNRGGFLPFINYDATEFCQHSKAGLRDSSREKTPLQAGLQSSRTGMEVHRQKYRDKRRKYTASTSQCKIQYCNSKMESADGCQPFGLVDGMFRVKPVRLLPSHNSAEDLTERFSSHFFDKITNLPRDLLNCAATTHAAGDISSSSFSLARFAEIFSKVVSETILKVRLKVTARFQPGPSLAWLSHF